jgi:hypothetical protein
MENILEEIFIYQVANEWGHLRYMFGLNLLGCNRAIYLMILVSPSSKSRNNEGLIYPHLNITSSNSVRSAFETDLQY